MTIFIVRRVCLNFDIGFCLIKRRMFHKSIEFRNRVENLLKRRFFFDQSFSIYGGISGLYDFGPMGCALKFNLLDEWRRFFILEENMLQVDCSTLTPIQIMAASGHLSRFTDLMVKDSISGECYRVDHLLKEHFENILKNQTFNNEKKSELTSCLKDIDTMSIDEIKAIIKKYNIKAPTTNNDLSEPTSFNLMFATTIGPSGNIKGWIIFLKNLAYTNVKYLKCIIVYDFSMNQSNILKNLETFISFE